MIILIIIILIIIIIIILLLLLLLFCIWTTASEPSWVGRTAVNSNYLFKEAVKGKDSH